MLLSGIRPDNDTPDFRPDGGYTVSWIYRLCGKFAIQHIPSILMSCFCNFDVIEVDGNVALTSAAHLYVYSRTGKWFCNSVCDGIDLAMRTSSAFFFKAVPLCFRCRVGSNQWNNSNIDISSFTAWCSTKKTVQITRSQQLYLFIGKVLKRDSWCASGGQMVGNCLVSLFVTTPVSLLRNKKEKCNKHNKMVLKICTFINIESSLRSSLCRISLCSDREVRFRNR